MVRNKRGERERREVREGEHTGGQWDQESSTLIIIHDGGRWRRLLVAFIVVGVSIASSSLSVFVLCCRRSLLSVAHRCPSFFHIRRALLNCLALGEVESAGRQIILGRRHWWCHVSCVCASSRIPGWSYVVFVSAGRCLGLLCASHVCVPVVGWSRSFVGRLLSFLDGWDRVSGSASCDVTWGRCCGEADVGCCWAVCRGCGRHRWHGGG